MDKRGGGVSRFSFEVCFVPNRQKTTWANPSVFQKVSGIKKFLRSRVSRFCRSFLSHSTEKIRRGTLCLGNVLVLKNFWIISYHDFVKIFRLTCQNFCGEPFNDS